jgi:hypothetical protein
MQEILILRQVAGRTGSETQTSQAAVVVSQDKLDLGAELVLASLASGRQGPGKQGGPNG